MSMYKQARKVLIKQLTKKQKKQLKSHIQDIADEMLNAYAETLRLKLKAQGSVTNYLPIADTDFVMRINIQTDYKF